MAETLTTDTVQVVDFQALSITHKEKPPVNDDAVQELARNLYSACSTMGFAYLKNHGISQDEVDNAQRTVATFFELTKEVKARYQKETGVSRTGWDELERESTNTARPGDLKESLDIRTLETTKFDFPGEDLVPNFKSTIQTLYNHLKELGLRILTALAIGLNVDPEVFISTHQSTGTEDGCSMIRFNYYPKLTGNIEMKPGQIRCGEHSDYGSITILFQDSAGGLEIAAPNGTFIPAPPIPGTVLVNIADQMQRWTADKLKSAVHRVIIPEEEAKKQTIRQSIAFFMIPDSDAVIRCLDGSDKYPPIKSGQYLDEILLKTYAY